MSSGSSLWYLPHPYGVLPLGNSSQSPAAAAAVSRKRFGSLASVLEGPPLSEQAHMELLMELTAFLSIADLCRLSSCSTGLFMIIHSSDVWKQAYHALSPTRLRFEDSWKASAVRIVLREMEAQSTITAGSTSNIKNKKSKKKNITGSTKETFRHTPFRISSDRALFNDSLFQSWLCTILPCTYKLSPPPALRSRLRTIPKLSNISLDAFDKYEALNQPVVITDVATKWPLFRILNGDLQNLSRNQKEIFVETSSSDVLYRCEHTNMSVEEYCRYAKEQTDERPIYLFDAEFRRSMREDMYEVPECFARDDFFRVLGPDRRPKYQWLIAGPKRGGSSFHIDPNYTNAWNACLTGRKRWIMFPPGCVPCGVHPSDDMSKVTAPLSLGEWMLNHYEASVEKYKDQGREVIANAGDIVFVPCGWWHFVVNLEDSVAITQNYVSRNNLAKVILFLKKLPNSISGIGEDEEDGELMTAERRRTIGDEFENAMKEKFPDILREAMEAHQEQLDEINQQRGRRKRGRGDEGGESTFVESLLDASSEGFSFSFTGL